MKEKSLFGDTEENNVTISSVIKELTSTPISSIYGLLDFNKMCYEEFHRQRNYSEMVLCKMMYKRVIEAAKKQGLDVSRYPEELNYLERQN
jgi:hypothetical protein